MVTDDIEGAERYQAEITEDMWKSGSGGVLNAAFYNAANARFAGKPVEEIVAWVAGLRSRLGESADEIDPRYAEWIIRGAARDELDLVQKIAPDVYVPLQLLLTAQLVVQQHFVADELEGFLDGAERLAAQWANE
jgi:hypothetical protein